MKIKIIKDEVSYTEKHFKITLQVKGKIIEAWYWYKSDFVNNDYENDCGIDEAKGLSDDDISEVLEFINDLKD